MSARKYLHRLLGYLTRHLIDFEVHGLENVPRQGRLVVYINHINFLDPLLTCALMPRDVVMLSKKENYDHPLIGPLAKAYGVIPVRRGEVDVMAFKRSLAVLTSECALLAAPEGTRSGDGRLREAKDGITRLALRTDSPLIPVGLVGQEEFPSRFRRLRRTRVCVWIGRPFRFLTSDRWRLSRREIKSMTVEAMKELAALLPLANRGVYGTDADGIRKWISYDLASRQSS